MSLPITIFTLDTGRLFQETYDVFHKTAKKI
jgi:phosphoadenosine phosphosulfate reductase